MFSWRKENRFIPEVFPVLSPETIEKIIEDSPLSKSFAARLLSLYFRILHIPSPSGGEAALRDDLVSFLNRIPGIQIETDRTGNLIAELSATDTDLPGIFLTAHMDTYLRKPVPMTPFQNGNWIRNLSAPILGGDDKTGVAAFCVLMEELGFQETARGKIRLILTVHEENLSFKGWSYGARKLAPEKLSDMDLGLAMDVPSGKNIKERNFLIYHCEDTDPILGLVQKAGKELGLSSIYMESERKGFIGGDATTFYRNHQKKIIDFATGNYHEHTPSEATNLPEFLEQVAWLKATCFLLLNPEEHWKS